MYTDIDQKLELINQDEYRALRTAELQAQAAAEDEFYNSLTEEELLYPVGTDHLELDF